MEASGTTRAGTHAAAAAVGSGHFRHILVATDGSEGARRAEGRAVALASAFGADLSIVSVAATPTIPALYPANLALMEEIGAECQRAVAQAVAVARAAGVEPRHHGVREGQIRASINAAARELGADLIVVGSHGWGVLDRLLLGSTADYLAHHAPCSVLVVRPAAPGG